MPKTVSVAVLCTARDYPSVALPPTPLSPGGTWCSPVLSDWKASYLSRIIFSKTLARSCLDLTWFAVSSVLQATPRADDSPMIVPNVPG